MIGQRITPNPHPRWITRENVGTRTSDITHDVNQPGLFHIKCRIIGPDDGWSDGTTGKKMAGPIRWPHVIRDSC